MSESLLDLATHQLLRGTLFFLLAVGLCRVWAGRSARVRYLVWLVMLASLLVPALGLVHVPLPGGMILSSEPTVPATSEGLPTSPAATPLPDPVERADLAPAPTSTQASWTRAQTVAAAWAFGSLLMLALWVRHAVLLRGILARSCRAPAVLQAALDRCARNLSLRRPVPVRLSREVVSPCVVRARRPVLLLPEQDLDTVLPHSWNPVFVHELLHVRRLDLWVQHGVAVTRALWFFHPAAWLAARLLVREREQAVDETVITEGGIDPMQYQKSLVDVAASLRRHPTANQPAMALTPAARDLVHRIHLLRRKTMPRFRAWPVMAFAALVGFGCMATAATDDKDDPAAARVQEVCAKHEIQLPATKAKGLPLSAGGVRAMVFIDAKGRIALLDQESLASTGDGFPPALAEIPLEEIEEEEPPEELDVVEVEVGEEVIEELERVTEESIEEVEPDPTRIELAIRALEPDGGRPTFRVNAAKAASVDEVAELVQEIVDAGTVSEMSLTVYPYNRVRVGTVIKAVSRIQTLIPKLAILYVGVPADWEDPGSIHKALDKDCQLQGFAESDVILVSDARAPWTSHARIMSWLGSHEVARITVATTHEGKLVKLCQYLPMDLGLER